MVLIRIIIDLGSVLSLISLYCGFLSLSTYSLVILYPELCSNSVVSITYTTVIKANFTAIFQATECRESESEVAQLAPTLSDPTDCSLPGSSVHEIFQARVLEWVIMA